MCIVNVAVLEHAVLNASQGLSSASRVAARSPSYRNEGSAPPNAQQPPRYCSRSPGGKGRAAPSPATDPSWAPRILCRVGAASDEVATKSVAIISELPYPLLSCFRISPYASQNKRRRLVVGRLIETSPRCDPRRGSRNHCGRRLCCKATSRLRLDNRDDFHRPRIHDHDLISDHEIFKTAPCRFDFHNGRKHPRSIDARHPRSSRAGHGGGA
jgi:hypothetical protein